MSIESELALLLFEVAFFLRCPPVLSLHRLLIREHTVVLRSKLLAFRAFFVGLTQLDEGIVGGVCSLGIFNFGFDTLTTLNRTA